jgi:hypothetical protein
MKSKFRDILRQLGGPTKALVITLILILVLIFIWIFADFNRAASNIGHEQLTVTAEKIKNTVLKNDIFLMPDMAYLTKIKRLFYTSIPESDERQYADLINSAGIIKNIIQKSVYFNRDILSVYIMLADNSAPYVLVDGELRLKLSMEDSGWEKTCFSMNTEYYFDWRIMKFYYASQREVVSLYRKINSVNWETNEKTEGYVIINYDRKGFENQILETLGYGKSICFLNGETGHLLSIGKNDLNAESAAALLKTGNSAHPKKAVKRYAGQIQNSPLFFIITQDDVPLMDFFRLLRFRLLFILIIIGIIISILFFHNTVQSERIMRTEIELLYGRTQLNSHFLLNAMDYIYWKNVTNYGPENEESEMMEKLCSILKYTLDSSGTLAALGEEIEYAKMYLRMQKIRKEIQMDAEWNIPEETLGITTEKLIVQTILENSIQHGMNAGSQEKINNRAAERSPEVRQGLKPLSQIKIRVSSKIIKSDLYLYFEDSGKGMDAGEMAELNGLFKGNSIRNSGHIGLVNINRRLKLQYGKNYGIALRNSELGGLLVELKLRIIQKPIQ